LSFTAERVDPDLLTAMRETLAHRGPDGAGLWMADDRSIGLAHRRLAILDLSDAANQPMVSDDGAWVLTFNGEIYNHAALRTTLDAEAPARWRTDHSDTEVLLRAWQHWGVDALPRLRGMFAFAMWDTRTRTLWLVRDRVGIKPLYYRHTTEHVAFASEVKALLRDPAVPRQVNEDAFFYYLSTQNTPPEDTLLAGIRKVPVATWIAVAGDGTLRSGRYWDPWDHVVPQPDASEAAIAERVLAGLDESVRLRSMADVPVGTLLSGGIDSSAVTALLARHQPTPVRTFSVGYRDVACDDVERDYARRMAAHVGARHAERVLDVDTVLATIERVVYLQDEPSGHGVAIANLGVAQLAREHGVRVILSGEGADELFCGYPAWRRLLCAQALADRPGARIVGRAAAAALALLGRDGGARAERLRRLRHGEQVFWGGSEGWTHVAKLRLLSPRLRARYRHRSPWETLAPIHTAFRAKAWEPSPLHWATYLTLHTRLPEMLLRRLDRTTMGASVEGRVPFLDHHLVELALGIPTNAKLAPGPLKRVLKHAVGPLLPPAILARPTQGMPIVPIAFVDRDRVATVAGDAVARFCHATDLLDPAPVREIVAGRGRRLWILFEVACWWRRFVAGSGTPP
jgi:asparagine synthase (glutamine-hydrolysing)